MEMTDPVSNSGSASQQAGGIRVKKRRGLRWQTKVAFWGLAGITAACLSWMAWLAATGLQIKSELNSAAELIPVLQREAATTNQGNAAMTVELIRGHTLTAKDAVDQPLWTLASTIPVLGANFSAVAEVARSADDVVALGLNPLVKVYGSLNWGSLLPSSAGMDLGSIEAASPVIAGASNAVSMSADRLNQIDATGLLPEVRQPLEDTRKQLRDVTGALHAAADVSLIAPSMLGGNAPRSYLLMVQNNAESRASGGIPGALAVLTVHEGNLSLAAQSTAGEMGVMTPPVMTDPVQQDIYSSRLGKFVQDVNLTPDFPTAASTAQSMWERKTGQRVDGVLSVDPVALSYILQATGPVQLDGSSREATSTLGLPAELSGDNVVQTLLSDVYAKIEEPDLQDAYFASIAQKVFEAMAEGRGEPKGLISGITRGTEEGRILVWSGAPKEQSVLANYPVGGSIAGPSVAPAQFGVYFNDGTGAKMDYYVKRTVQLVKECARDGYEETTVRITSMNTAPADAATSLPAYVTGGGNFGVPAGSVQTNIVAYGPVQANVETAKLDGQKTAFAPYLHSNRPVGVLAIRLAPGESKTVEFTFGKIVQHTEPNVVVTPTIQPVNDVMLATVNVDCGQQPQKAG